MRPLVILVLVLALCGFASAEGIPRDSTVYVSDENEWLAHVRAEILKQRVPVRLAALPDKAEYVIRGNFTGDSAALEIVSADGYVVWAERDTFRRFGWNKSASRFLVKKLKAAILKR